MHHGAMRLLNICGCDIYTVASFSLSATFPTVSAAAPVAAFAGSLGLEALFSFAFCLLEVVSLGSSLVKGMKSGAPGRYFLKGSGTLSPCVHASVFLVFALQVFSGRSTHILRLVVLHNTAHRTCGGTQRGVETVDVGLLHIGLLLAAKPDFESAGLVVGAVGARDKLLVFTPVWCLISVTGSLCDIDV